MNPNLPEPAEKSNVHELPTATILKALAWLHPDADSVFELCALGPKAKQSPLWDGFAGSQKAVIAGWFTDRQKAAALAVKIQAAGIYCTLNPCRQALLGRANQRLVAGVSRTKDGEIERIKNLLVDLDPERPEGVSSTDAEHDAALAVALDVAEALRADGWPEALATDSGNGAGLIYAIDLPNDADAVATLRQCLVAIAHRHRTGLENAGCALDLAVFNPGRLTRLLGTQNRKGDSTADRPHRQSRILTLPAERVPVALELLEKLAAMAPAEDVRQATPGRQAPAAQHAGDGLGPVDVDAYLAHYHIDVVNVKPGAGGTLYCLANCLFNPEHADGDAAVWQGPGGALEYKCLHNSCAGKKWEHARPLISGQESMAPFMAGYKAPARTRTTRTPTPDTGATPAANGYHLSDLGNAERLVAQHGQDLRYCYESNKWWTWTGSRWTKDAPAGAWHLAKRTVKSIYGELAQAAKADADVDLRKAIFRHALTSEKAGRLAGMLLLAQSENGIPVKPADFDADPWLLNCLNGTLDLRTGKLLPHDRLDMCTRQAPVASDPAATCERFESFLLEIMDGDSDMVAFLQRAFGYSLTGDCSEQCLFVPYGHGSNGKSTLLAAVAHVFGDYGLQTPTDTLLTKKNDGIPNDIARLDGPRFVSALEVNQGRRLNESLVKQLVGQDTVSARFLREEFFDFKPQFKLWLGTNHRPVIKDTTHAMWRRLRLIPFTVTIPDAKQDRNLATALKAEAPGILAWMVRGCLSWQHGGLSTPDAVTAATAEYRTEQDVLGQFLDDACVTLPGAETTAGDLYKKYQEWCLEAGEKRPITQIAFGQALTERGFEKRKGAKGLRLWLGIYLKDSENAEQS